MAVVAKQLSYAQHGEDVVLSRAFAGQRNGFYVDVGAHDPTSGSITRHFYDLGWTGVNVEPQVELYKEFARLRPRDVSVNVGIGAEPGELDFHHVPEAPGMSSFSSTHADLVNLMGYRTETSRIAVITLNELFERYVGDRGIDFMNVDVEGFEEAVLGTFDWQRWLPRVVIVETFASDPHWEQRMRSYGYRTAFDDGVNRFYVRADDLACLGPRLFRPRVFGDRYELWDWMHRKGDAPGIFRRLLHPVMRFASARPAILRRTLPAGSRRHRLVRRVARMV